MGGRRQQKPQQENKKPGFKTEKERKVALGLVERQIWRQFKDMDIINKGLYIYIYHL